MIWGYHYFRKHPYNTLYDPTFQGWTDHCSWKPVWSVGLKTSESDQWAVQCHPPSNNMRKSNRIIPGKDPKNHEKMKVLDSKQSPRNEACGFPWFWTCFCKVKQFNQTNRNEKFHHLSTVVELINSIPFSKLRHAGQTSRHASLKLDDLS